MKTLSAMTAAVFLTLAAAACTSNSSDNKGGSPAPVHKSEECPAIEGDYVNLADPTDKLSINQNVQLNLTFTIGIDTIVIDGKNQTISQNRSATGICTGQKVILNIVSDKPTTYTISETDTGLLVTSTAGEKFEYKLVGAKRTHRKPINNGGKLAVPALNFTHVPSQCPLLGGFYVNDLDAKEKVQILRLPGPTLEIKLDESLSLVVDGQPHVTPELNYVGGCQNGKVFFKGNSREGAGESVLTPDATGFTRLDTLANQAPQTTHFTKTLR